MKTSQWVGALVVLVVMVFIITFAMNFLRPGTREVIDTRTTKETFYDGPLPTFYYKSLPANPANPAQGVDPASPAMAAYAIYREERKTDHLDFLMENPNDADIKIGLISKNCRCAKVDVVPVSEEWKRRRAGLAAGEIMAAYPAAELGLENFFGITSSVLWIKPDEELKKLEDALPPSVTLDPRDLPQAGQQETVVPRNSLSFVRLGWDDTKTGVEHFSAELWIGNPKSSKTAMLEVTAVHFVSPVRVEFPDLKAGDLNESDLEKKPFEGAFRVWSSTRPALKLKTEVIRPMRFDEKRFDPFEVGQPVPMTGEELANLHRLPDAAGTVLCAYRIPVKINGRSPDKTTAVDLGSFRRRLLIWNEDDDKGQPDKPKQPIEVTVSGSVQGRVQIGTTLDNGRILLGVFDSATGSSKQAITLTANSAGVDLEVDRERTPEYLRDGAELEKLAPLAGLPRWKLTVRVKPNLAHGTFPRADDSMYRDSAVFLKVKGDVVQNVRVPVDGTANDQ
jgi:hypothetical protein